MDNTFSDFTGAPGVGCTLPHDLVLFLLPAAVACTEMDSSNMHTRVQEACSTINKIADDHKEKSKEQNEQLLFSLEGLSPDIKVFKGAFYFPPHQCIALGGILVGQFSVKRAATLANT